MNGGNRWPYFTEYTKVYGKGLLKKFGTYYGALSSVMITLKAT